MERLGVRFGSLLKRRWLWGMTVAGGIAVAVGMQQGLRPSGLLAAAGDPPATQHVRDAKATPGESVRPVQTARVTRGGARSTTTYPGTVRAAQMASLAFRVGGPLIEVKMKPGDKVRRGEVLMRIDPRDFQSAVDAAQSALDAAQAKLLMMKRGAREEDILALEAGLDAAEARHRFLQGVFERNKRMIQSNTISRQNYDSSESDLLATEAEIRGLKQELQKARTGARIEDIQAMEAQIRGLTTSLKTAQDRLADTCLRAPFDGRVTRQLVENYEQVAPGQTVLAMHDISNIEIDVDLPEKEILHRSLDEPFTVCTRFLAIENRTFQAAFKEIDTEADPSTRTYKVTFLMPGPPDVNILPGMVADVGVQSCAGPAAGGQNPVIPATAVRSDQSGRRFAWVVSGSEAVERRPIAVGSLSASNRYEVVEGLTEGETVVTAGAAFLYDGVKVRVANEGASDRAGRLTQLAD